MEGGREWVVSSYLQLFCFFCFHSNFSFIFLYRTRWVSSWRRHLFPIALFSPLKTVQPLMIAFSSTLCFSLFPYLFSLPTLFFIFLPFPPLSCLFLPFLAFSSFFLPFSFVSLLLTVLPLQFNLPTLFLFSPAYFLFFSAPFFHFPWCPFFIFPFTRFFIYFSPLFFFMFTFTFTSRTTFLFHVEGFFHPRGLKLHAPV